jgi:hypothetical protein
MTVLVIGAARLHDEPLRRAADACSGVRIITTGSSPDWVLVSTQAQRVDAVSQYSLPPYRVIVAPMLAGDTPIAGDRLLTLLTRMREIGPARPLVSGLGLRVTRPLLPYLMGPMISFALATAGDHWRERRVAEKLRGQAAKEAKRASRRAAPEQKGTDVSRE